MPLHRRDFMKVFGISAASLLLARCRSPFAQPTCYMATVAPTVTPSGPITASMRERLRLYWLYFEELGQKASEDTENKLGKELAAGHRFALDELVADRGIHAPVADLVQEAYEAAIYHVWRSNAPMTCYDMAFTYSPNSAAILVEQSQVLNQIARETTIDPATLAKAQTALEHDMAFYALTDAEVEELYKQISNDINMTGQSPSFEKLPLELTPEGKEATQFIIDLLTNK